MILTRIPWWNWVKWLVITNLPHWYPDFNLPWFPIKFNLNKCCEWKFHLTLELPPTQPKQTLHICVFPFIFVEEKRKIQRSFYSICYIPLRGCPNVFQGKFLLDNIYLFLSSRKRKVLTSQQMLSSTVATIFHSWVIWIATITSSFEELRGEVKGYFAQNGNLQLSLW